MHLNRLSLATACALSVTGFSHYSTAQQAAGMAAFAESVFGQPLDTGGYSQFVTYESQQPYGARLALRF